MQIQMLGAAGSMPKGKNGIFRDTRAVDGGVFHTFSNPIKSTCKQLHYGVRVSRRVLKKRSNTVLQLPRGFFSPVGSILRVPPLFR